MMVVVEKERLTVVCHRNPATLVVAGPFTFISASTTFASIVAVIVVSDVDVVLG
jgi:hypothetical protein